MTETIKVYVTSDIGASQSLVTLEDFIGYMDNAELADDSTVDTGNAVTAINGLIYSLEQRDAEIERLLRGIRTIAGYLNDVRTGDASFVCEALLAGAAYEQKAAPAGECPDCGEPMATGNHKDECSWWDNRIHGQGEGQ